MSGVRVPHRPLMLERLVWAEISIPNFIYNLQSIRTLVGPSVKTMAIVKANAYGHGAVELAKAAIANGASHLGVVCLYEARQLRNAGITSPILILNYIDEDSLEDCVDLGLTLNIMDEQLLKRLDGIAKRKNKRIPIHVKIDSGMHRLGLLPEQVLSYIQSIESYKNIKLEGIFTHFATADEKDHAFAYEQLQTFLSVLNVLKAHHIHIPIVHAANSAATLRMPEAYFDMVRPGNILYGMAPSGDFTPPFVPKPILSLKTRIVQIRKISQGETVGYGRTFRAAKPTLVAAIPVGYADGFRRAPKNWGKVLIGGMFSNILGRISMDQTSIDVTDIPNACVGDEVVLIGKQKNNQITADHVAAAIGTINYEVTSSLASRVSRLYVT